MWPGAHYIPIWQVGVRPALDPAADVMRICRIAMHMGGCDSKGRSGASPHTRFERHLIYDPMCNVPIYVVGAVHFQREKQCLI